MFSLGVASIFVGLVLVIFNRRLGDNPKRRRRKNHPDPFLYSIKRQNIAFVGGAFVGGGLFMIYLS